MLHAVRTAAVTAVHRNMASLASCMLLSGPQSGWWRRWDTKDIMRVAQRAPRDAGSSYRYIRTYHHTTVAAAASAADAPSSSSSSSGANGTSSSGAAVCSQRCCIHDVPGAVAEEVAEVLLAYGAQSASIEEFRPPGAPEQEIFHRADGSFASGPESQVWDRCTVVAHLPPDADAEQLLGYVTGDFQLDHLQRTVALVHMQDWQQSIKDSYVPSKVCEGLWIVPSWSEPPSDPGATIILLEPGLAFGTGDHPTTRLCLRWLRQLSQRGQLEGATILDYGSGSGVLAVAALLLGASKAVGTDIDPLAVKATRQNAELNGVGSRLEAHVCSASVTDGEEEEGWAQGQRQLFDVTVANILQGPLLGLAPRLAAHTQPGGLLGLSGILTEQAETVVAGYSKWFEGFEVVNEDRWALITAVRRQQ